MFCIVFVRIIIFVQGVSGKRTDLPLFSRKKFPNRIRENYNIIGDWQKTNITKDQVKHPEYKPQVCARGYCALRHRGVLCGPAPGAYCVLLYRGYIVLSGAEMYYELHHRGSIVLSGPRVYFTQKWRGLILCRNMVWWFGRQVPLQRFIRIKTSQKPQGQNINRENAWKRRGFWKIILKDKFGIVHPFCLCYTENHWGR